ncbi:MAG: hypothetical protein ACXQTI_08260 [Candidatus Nezhaarchaeales archaeon]
MSGFGGLVSASVIILVFTVALIFLVNSVLLGAQLYDWKTSMLKSVTSSKPKPHIDSGITYSYDSSTLVKLNVTNIGDKGLRIKDFLKSDLIIVYHNGTVRKAVKLEYNDSLSPNTWRIARVLIGNREGDFLNPINTASKSGIWDPYETLELEAWLDDVIDTGKSWGVVLALPNGVVSTAEF